MLGGAQSERTVFANLYLPCPRGRHNGSRHNRFLSGRVRDVGNGLAEQSLSPNRNISKDRCGDDRADGCRLGSWTLSLRASRRDGASSKRDDLRLFRSLRHRRGARSPIRNRLESLDRRNSVTDMGCPLWCCDDSSLLLLCLPLDGARNIWLEITGENESLHHSYRQPPLLWSWPCTRGRTDMNVCVFFNLSPKNPLKLNRCSTIDICMHFSLKIISTLLPTPLEIGIFNFLNGKEKSLSPI